MARRMLLLAQFVLIVIPFAVLTEYLPRTPLFLWRCAKEPITTFTIFWRNCPWVLYNCAWALRYQPPAFLAWSYGKITAIVSRLYWRAYERARDARKQRFRQRRRALTRTGIRMPVQERCLFLNKLPAEIRMAIYDMYFEHRKVMVFPVKRNLRIRTVALCANVRTHKHYESEFLQARTIQNGLLDLSLTCKQIYAETIDQLYASNTFCFTDHNPSFSSAGSAFGHIAHMMALRREILPQRWQAITSVEYNPNWGGSLGAGRHIAVHQTENAVSRQYEIGDLTWYQLCATFDSMHGLSRIVISEIQLGRKLEHLHTLLALKGRSKSIDVHVSSYQSLVNDFKTELEKGQIRLILPNGKTFTHDPTIGSRGMNGRPVNRKAYEYGYSR